MSEETKQLSAEPSESIERLLTAVKDAQCLGETPEQITVRVQKVYAAYLAQERTIATLRATIERYENLIVKMSSSEAWHSSTWAEARAAREAILAAREKEKTDE